MKLVHYTKCKTGLDYILESMSIRLSPLLSTNDPYEYKKNLAYTDRDEQLTNEKLETFFKAENDVIKQGIKVGCFVAEKNAN